MFGIGMPELLVILAVALIVIGPKKLPDLAKSLGRAMGEFKRATRDLKDSIQQETGLDDVRESFKEFNQDLKGPVDLGEQAPAGSPSDKAADETSSDDNLAKVKQAFDGLNQEKSNPGDPPSAEKETPLQDQPGHQEQTPNEK